MHPALHRKNTPSLALNKYLKILVFYFTIFKNQHLNFSPLYSESMFMNEKLNNQTIECIPKICIHKIHRRIISLRKISTESIFSPFIPLTPQSKII